MYLSFTQITLSQTDASGLSNQVTHPVAMYLIKQNAGQKNDQGNGLVKEITLENMYSSTGPPVR